MKYLKNLDSFVKSNDETLIENVNYHKVSVKDLGSLELPDPVHGDLKLSVMPFENTGSWASLPEGFKLWEESFNEILKHIPLQEGANTHYVTIDTKFFTRGEFLRREGVHMDGNFCVDPNFTSVNEYKASWGGSKPSWGGARFKNCKDKECYNGGSPKSKRNKKDGMKSSWGGARPSWGGARVKEGLEEIVEMSDNSHVDMDWVLPYDIVIPISEYVSGNKGGILTVSSEVGCQAWDGEFYGEVLGEGSYENMSEQLTDDRKIVFEKNELYFMSSNTPHETLFIDKGKRRTFMRVTLNHNYDNSQIR